MYHIGSYLWAGVGVIGKITETSISEVCVWVEIRNAHLSSRSSLYQDHKICFRIHVGNA